MRDANREQCIKASKEMYSVLANCTNSEASTIAGSVSGLDGVEARAKLHAKCSRRTPGIIFRSAT